MSNKRKGSTDTARSNNNTRRRVTNNGDNESNMSNIKGKWGRYSRGSSVDEAAVNSMFDNIADDDDPNVASYTGISQLADHLGIDPYEDIRILVLLFKMGANSKPAQISRSEWTAGCEKLQADSVDKFKMLLPSLDFGFMERSEFREFHKFCFKFNLEGTYKTLSKDLVISLVEMTLSNRIDKDRVSTFQEFLRTTKDDSYDRITLDQWVSFLDFSIECTDLSKYDEETSAWPVLIDDYVDYSTSMKD